MVEIISISTKLNDNYPTVYNMSIIIILITYRIQNYNL